MAKKQVSVYIHLVWTTWDRQPWISAEIESKVYKMIISQAIKSGCKPIAINGIADHVHLLIKFPTTIRIADLVKNMKGVSSRLINLQNLVSGHFTWSSNYGVFSVSRWDTDRVKYYIKHQKQHHKSNNLIEQLEETRCEKKRP